MKNKKMIENNVEDEYWWYGLHDSVLTDIKCGEITPDYSIKNYRYNYLKFFLDTEHAIGEPVKEITFYNYSASWKGGNIKDFSFYKGSWWISDSLEKKGDKWVLTLTLQHIEKHHPVDEIITINFEQLEVVREED